MSGESQKTLRALAKELKIPLTDIAQEAELNNLESIARKSRSAMSLIDGYLLAAQTEHGQVSLPLENTGIGSIIFEVSREIEGLAASQNIALSTASHSHASVMTHALGLKTAIGCLAELAINEDSADQEQGQIELISYEKRNGKAVAGVVSNRLKFTPKDIKRADMLYGESHLALSTTAHDSGVRLAIVSQLANSIGASLTTIRRSGQNGIGLELAKSQQLQLV